MGPTRWSRYVLQFLWPVMTALGAPEFLAWTARLEAQTAPPVLLFSDLTGGPATGNGDDSEGRVAGRDGAIVTVWERNLGASPEGLTVNCAGAPVASVYLLENASSPADLWTYHRIQKLTFQVSHLARTGSGHITVSVNGQTSNALPFTVRPGKIFFVKTSGNDGTGDGSWKKPWKTIPKATTSMNPGDITYVANGVDQTTVSDYYSAVVLGPPAEPAWPKALIVYPGARSRIGNTTIRRGIFPYDSEANVDSTNWVVAGFTVTTGKVALQTLTGSRVVGNHVTAPEGDGADGAIGVWGSDAAVLGNENCGGATPEPAWDFGDGKTGTGPGPAHPHATPGTFVWPVHVSLDGKTCSQSGTVNIMEPSLLFTYTIAAVIHSPGAEGALFQSDVTAVNLGTNAVNLQLT